MNNLADYIDGILAEFSKMIKESPTDMIMYRLRFETTDGVWYEQIMHSVIFPEDDKLFKQTARYIIRESIADFALQTGRKGLRLYAPNMFDASYDVFSFIGTLRVGWSTYYPEVTDGNE